MLPPDVGILNAGHLILDAEDRVLVIHMLALLALRHDLLPLATLPAQDADAMVPAVVLEIESVDR